MKLAIPYEDGAVFPHFGKTAQFKIYDVTEAGVGGSMVLPAVGEGHGARAQLLRMLGISVVLCGGIGPGAVEALRALDITPIPGVSGDADQAAADFAAGRLAANTEELLHHRHQSPGGHSCHHCEAGCGEEEHPGA